MLKDGKASYTIEVKMWCNYQAKTTKINQRLQIILQYGQFLVIFPQNLQKYLI